MQVESFLYNAFREYYKRNIVGGPPKIECREFGYGVFGKKISARHLSFLSKEEFNRYLREKAPLYISYSPAYYEFPAKRPMEAKILEKADLIYEFDADDIKTDCKESHDSWECSCGERGKGNVSNCSKCGSGVKVDEWVCVKCLEVVKKQVKTLLGFLESDLGISRGIFLNYSGSKGYHIHVRNKALFHLSNSARIELLDYLTAHELDFAKLGFLVSANKRFVCPKLSEASGWGKKILDEFEKVFKKGNENEIAAIGGVRVKTAKELLKHKAAVLEGFEKGILFSLPGAKTQKFWESMISFVVEKQKLGVDRQTSVDIAKIIRVPNTLHGSTGLCAKEFSREELEGFDGLSDGVVFGDKPIQLKSVSTPKFYLGKQWWGPFKNQQLEVPEFVGIYLIAKKHAQLDLE